MDLTICEKVENKYIIISLIQQGNYHYRLTASIDNLIDTDIVLKAGKEEAIHSFRNIQIRYFGKIINEGIF